jgi:SAM-dependent methyltransferase
VVTDLLPQHLDRHCKEASFDVVLAASSIQYTQDRVAALRDLKRVCDPSGRVAIGLWSTPDKVEYRVVFKAVRDALPEPPLGKGPFRIPELRCSLTGECLGRSPSGSAAVDQ